MRPKGKMIALLAIFAAIGLVTATGAFTSVTATRTVSVQVAGDADALLQLQPYSGPNGNGAYSQLDGNDQLEIDLAGFGSVDGDGPNLNATTDIRNVFVITNQGSQEVNVNISDAGGHDGLVTFYNASETYGSPFSSGGLEEDDGGSAATLGIGDSVVVSIYVDTTNTPGLSNGTQLVDDITVTATATA